MMYPVKDVLRDKKYFIFDLDGTLIDEEAAHRQGLYEITKAMRRFGREMNNYQKLLHRMEKCSDSNRTAREAACLSLDVERYSMNFQENLDLIHHCYWSGVGSIFKWIDGAEDTLMRLTQQEKKISIVTNGGAIQHKKLEKLREQTICEFVEFDHMEVTGDYGEEKYKPNPYCLNKIIKDYGADRYECVYVGNSITQDGEMARRAGIDFVLIDFEEKYDNYSGNRIFHLSELLCK